MMFSKHLKYAAEIFVGALLFVIAFSVIYNQPIRFRPKMVVYDKSVFTLYPSAERPDQIILSPAEDSESAMRISWRTSESVTSGEVRYMETPAKQLSRKAELAALDAPELRSDRRTHSFSATLENLKPGASYTYMVGDKTSNIWSKPRSFTVVSSRKDEESFSFIWFGDVQTSPGSFGQILNTVNHRYPETAFYMISGDMVEDGEWRYMWDAFAAATSDVFSTKPVAATLGNHDYRTRGDNGRKYFQSLFNLPENGPANQAGTYSFKHQNVCFIVLDSNQEAGEQAKWLEWQLQKAAQADFKVIMFHHPPYGLKRGTHGPDIAKNWVPLFDRYGVDLVLNGHDHIYRRTKKIRGGQTVGDDEEGVSYVIAYSCEKSRKLEASEYAQKEMTYTPTYQVITVKSNKAGKSSLNYKAYDFQHRLVDEFTLFSKR